MHWSRQRWPARPNRLRHRHHCGSGSADGRDPSAGREDWTQRSTNIEHLKRANKVGLFEGHFEHGVALFSPRVYPTLQKNARSWWPPNLDQNNGDIWLFICFFCLFILLIYFIYLFFLQEWTSCVLKTLCPAPWRWLQLQHIQHRHHLCQRHWWVAALVRASFLALARISVGPSWIKTENVRFWPRTTSWILVDAILSWITRFWGYAQEWWLLTGTLFSVRKVDLKCQDCWWSQEEGEGLVPSNSILWRVCFIYDLDMIEKVQLTRIFETDPEHHHSMNNFFRDLDVSSTLRTDL